MPIPPDDLLTAGLSDEAVQRRIPLAGSVEQQIIERFRKGESIRSIAAALNINRSVVRRVLSQHGCETPGYKPKLADASLPEIRRLYDGGLPVAGVAARLGVSKNTMLRFMHENGIELRSRIRRSAA
jgi:DNA invertase Pin-like site-specific DNA recombinase